MHRDSFFRLPAVKIALWGFLAFGLLTVRFSPNWVVVYHGLRDARVAPATPAQHAAITRAILSSYSARGFYVLQQARDLNAAIDDPRHKIVRWRLLVPGVGHVLKLPAWMILGLAPMGCMALILALAAIGLRIARASGRPAYEAAYLGIIAGASAPFFTSMGLLGYYDSWLALALIAVAFARSGWVVALACLLAPWIDERFVIGLPLALGVRWILGQESAQSGWRWAQGQALIPLLLAGGYALLRLHLGGSGGSQTVEAYLNQFVLAERLSLAQRLVGAWAGLRFGWIFVVAAVLGTWRLAPGNGRREAILLGLGVAGTSFIGLFTALDLGRSMVLIIPVVPLGWIWALRTRWWNQSQAGLLVAAAALLLPASHVVGKFRRPVDSLWSPPEPLLIAQNELGLMYGEGRGVPRDDALAVRWYRQAAELGLPEAQYNLGVMYARGAGVPKDRTEAMRWFRRAADQDFAQAEYNLGMIYAQGDGVPQDGAAALKWLGKSARQGDPQALYNLGVMYATGAGVPPDTARAVRWYRQALAAGYAEAANNLGVMYASGNGVPQDSVQACRWFLIGRAMGSAGAKRNLEILQDALTPEQTAEATRLARSRLGPEPTE